MTVTWLERMQWGADPAVVTLGKSVPHMNFTRLVIHHTVVSYWGDPVGYMKFMQRCRPELGLEVPYSFVVMPGATEADAIIGIGRGWARSGAHTIDYNDTAYGVAFAGDYTNYAPTPGMLQAVRMLGGYIKDPLPTLGHRDVYATACPGNTAYPLLELLQPPFWTAATEDEVQLSDETTKKWSVNDILNWTIEGINLLNAKVDALTAKLAAAPAPAPGVVATSTPKDIVDEFYRRLKD